VSQDEGRLIVEVIGRKEKVRAGALQTTRVFAEVCKARAAGFGVISAQGSSRSSKTYNILIWLIVYLLKYPNTSLSIVRATLPAIRGSVFRDFKEILLRMGLFDPRGLNKTEMVYTFPNGSFAEFFSTDSEQKLRGRKRHILFANEANELSFLAWQQLKLRTTGFALVDYNPSFDDDHWLCRLNKEKTTYHFVSTYKDNPFLEDAVVAEIESLREKNDSLWQVYGLGMQALVEGLIFRNVEEVEEFPPWCQKVAVGLDFGYTNDPSAAVKCGIVDDYLYLDELFYQTGMLAADLIAALKPHSRYKVISDSADPRLIQEIRNGGINIHPALKGAGSVLAGINGMLERKIRVTERSYNLLREFRRYAYAQDKEGRWLNLPVDGFDHGIDGVRYYVNDVLLGRNRRPKDYAAIFGRSPC
jgi:phage terminase large subunit